MDKKSVDSVAQLVLKSMPVSAILPAPEIWQLFRELTATRSDLDDKVAEAIESIRAASSVVGELEATLEERATKLKTLRSEVERLSQLAAVSESEAAPLLRELDELSRRGRAKERWIALGISLFAGLVIFVIGVVAGPYITHAMGRSETGAPVSLRAPATSVVTTGAPHPSANATK